MKFKQSNQLNEYAPEYDIMIDNMRGALNELEEMINDGEIEEHSVTHAFELTYFVLQLISKMEKYSPSIKTLYKNDIKQLKDMINKL